MTVAPPVATIDLVRPIEAHGETVTRLAVREPAARDLAAFRLGDTSVGNWLPVIASLCAIPQSSVDRMHPADVLAAIEAIGPLFLPPPATGVTS